MASFWTECPESSNSTDCLLRGLLAFLSEERVANENKFDWDPITFGFTVAIAAAAAFALITIVQTALTTSLGRRKTHPRAIGKWSLKTQWMWKWTSMGCIHTMSKPVLRLADIGTAIVRSGSSMEDDAGLWDDCWWYGPERRLFVTCMERSIRSKANSLRVQFRSLLRQQTSASTNATDRRCIDSETQAQKFCSSSPGFPHDTNLPSCAMCFLSPISGLLAVLLPFKRRPR